MQFREHQLQAHSRTAWLVVCFFVLLVALCGFVNLVLGLGWRLLAPFAQGYPALFFETNTALIMLFVIGGSLVELHRLQDGGGPRVARWVGGQEVTRTDDALHRRLLNVVDEMALASGQPVPRVFVLPREDAINAFVAGWGPQDLSLCVTRGALERLTRAELQGLVAHEFGHIEGDDLPLSMRLLALVWGLSLVHGYGRHLMASDEQGRVNPLSWLAGVVFATLGWAGWLAGRLLQAAVSRQREFLADACAIQYTRTRDGLGNVLRKIWHDQQVLAGRMRHPAADMVASLLLHESGHAAWLASHPPLPVRILRVCGSVLPPLPAPLVRLQASEPLRRSATPRGAPPGALAASGDAGEMREHTVDAQQGPMASLPGTTGDEEIARRERLLADREAMQRLQHRVGPTESRLIVLALIMNPANNREHKLWRQLAEGVHQQQQILDDVGRLLPVRRVPEFERLTELIAKGPLEHRRALAEQARDLLRADGRVSPRDRLWWLTLRHRMGMPQNKQAFMRPVTGQGQDLSNLSPEDQHHVKAVSAYLARMLPMEPSDGSLAPANQAWLAAVNRRIGASWQGQETPQRPDADALAHALSGLQELSWMMRPQLLKAWVEEAMNHSPHGLMSHETADALRLMASLLEAPMPPMLEAHYRSA
ncbi:MAG: M48 family metalloprotease [Burkholderiales bacterium]|nr:M48 family metalloprotease [Burkholderiales bacterium]MBH2015066.1 M48 family metalloprotease [Burkholderiales bacterium]